ncbi:hypothetical protein B0T16DRAFT_386624 [Cercophora newfieldiana]|uniref:DUF7703 domain-containing protein n=1 Tax=Cercophora newfieldiana TaxID=92897 RepID=A0AA39YGL7_9PEZI|nr:hypothetical protein B0T16DRAFT_386624 [Cercophora newfieldiana]
MALDDNGSSKDSVPTGQKLTIVIVFHSVALWNVVELGFIIWATFKRRSGLYFWSFVVSSCGIIFHDIGFLLKFLQLTNPYLFVTFIFSGWCAMVTGQSFVLYSRLHLIMTSPSRLKLVKTMIIVDAIVCHVPTGIMGFGVNSNNAAPFIRPFSVMEKLQVTVFFIQEITISGLYIYETVKLMRIRRGVPEHRPRGSKSSRNLMGHLIAVNVIIVMLDITILALEYAGMYDLQTAYKGFVYSVGGARDKVEQCRIDPYAVERG